MEVDRNDQGPACGRALKNVGARLAALALAILRNVGHDLGHVVAASAPGHFAALTAGGGATHRSVLLICGDFEYLSPGWENYTPGGIRTQLPARYPPGDESCAQAN